MIDNLGQSYRAFIQQMHLLRRNSKQTTDIEWNTAILPIASQVMFFSAQLLRLFLTWSSKDRPN